MSKKEDSRTWLVTGSNRGIGLAFAQSLFERGDRVIATARNPDKADDLHRLGVRVEQLDVSDEASIADLAAALRGEPVDVLINNAGIGEGGPSFPRLAISDLEESFRVNTVGPAAVTQALLPNLRAGIRRTIVMLSSGLASVSGNEDGGWIAYRVSKAALNQLTRSIAADLKKERFICVAISPGWVRTDMGGRGATISPAESVASMLRVIDRLTPSDTSRFLDRRGGDEPW